MRITIPKNRLISGKFHCNPLVAASFGAAAQRFPDRIAIAINITIMTTTNSAIFAAL
jgi:hypothetical protein